MSVNELNNLKMEDIKVKKDKDELKSIQPNINSTNDNINQHDKQILEYKFFELNYLEYEKAIKHDKRTYFQLYISLLKMKHSFIFSFCPLKDYNSQIIKIFLFFFFFSIHLTINALFFNDSTMHKIYIDKGAYNFIYQIPQILYSSIISGVINGLIRYLSLSQNNIIKLKQEKEKDKLEEKEKKLLDSLKIKFIIFFIITFIILLFFWYYITCFCGIYVNTQIQLLKDTIVSFIISLVYPFLTCLIPGVFRISALKDEKSSLGFIYKLSSIIMFII